MINVCAEKADMKFGFVYSYEVFRLLNAERNGMLKNECE